MGLFDKIRNEFIDIIEWLDNSNDTLVWKFPRYQNEIKNNAKLTVRESQQAVFFNEGVIADVFQPGMHTLTTQNMPILSTLKGWKYGFDSPFKADVFFISTKQFIDQKWGTKNPIIINDDRFGMIEIRAFGNFNFRLTDAGKFIKEIAGTDGQYTTEDLIGQLRTLIVNKFSDAMGEGSIPVEKFAANLEELSSLGMQKLNSHFEEYGLKITNFLVENISMPEELKKEIFEYSRLDKIDMQKLTQMKAAKSIEIAAGNDGGMGAGMGMGMGMSMGNMMTNAMMGQGQQQAQQQNQQTNFNAGGQTPPPIQQFFVAVNGAQTGPFSLEQMAQMIQQGQLNQDALIWKAGMAGWDKASSVSEIAQLFSQMMPPPPPPPIS